MVHGEEGNYFSGLLSGNGKRYFSSTDWYEGNFASGSANGAGKYYRSGKLYYEGNFDNKLYNQGTRWLLDDGVFIIAEKFSDGHFMEIQYPDKRIFLGTTKTVYYANSAENIVPSIGYLIKPDGSVIGAKWNNTFTGARWKDSTYTDVFYKSSNKKTEQDIHYMRGVAFTGFKKYTNAIQYLTKAIEGKTKNDSVYLYRGSAYGNINKLDSAMLDINKMLKLDGKNKDAIGWHATISLKQKDTTAALKDYATQIKFYPDDYVGYWNRGILLHQMKQYEQAITDYTKVIVLLPTGNDIVYVNRGKCYEAMNKKAEACSDYTFAKSKNNKDAGVRLLALKCGSQ
jgi:tetratricopeptide (TPR) repeat protein